MAYAYAIGEEAIWICRCLSYWRYDACLIAAQCFTRAAIESLIQIRRWQPRHDVTEANLSRHKQNGRVACRCYVVVDDGNNEDNEDD